MCSGLIDAANARTLLVFADTNADGETPEMFWLRRKWHDAWFDRNCGGAGNGVAGDGGIGSCTVHGATWSNSNPLTAGLLLEPNQRCDVIYYKDYPHPRAAAVPVGQVRCIEARVVLNELPTVSDHYGVLAVFECTK